MIEIVEYFSLFVAGGEGPCFTVGFIEVSRKASEKLAEGEVGFAVAVIAGGIVDYGGAILKESGVTRPEVAMEEGGLWLVLAQNFFDCVQECILFFEMDAGLLCYL